MTRREQPSMHHWPEIVGLLDFLYSTGYMHFMAQDLVFDVMHNVPLNVIGHHLHYYLDEGLVSPHQIEEKLDLMPWTPGEIWNIGVLILIQLLIINSELKNGRVPKSVTRLGYWKAEELQKFAYPASEYILGGLLPTIHG